MIQIKNLKKSFRTEEVETLALNNVNLKVEEVGIRRHYGPVGLRQVYFVEHHWYVGQPYRRQL